MPSFTHPVKGRVSFAAMGVAAVILLIALSIYLGRSSDSKQRAFAADAVDCNATPTELRFSCYRSLLGKYAPRDLGKLKDWVGYNTHLSFESKDASYAIFGTNCHTFYHAMGDYIASVGQGQDVNTLVNYCHDACTNGCVMGLYKRAALLEGFSDDILQKLYPACPKGSGHQCAHEIGHLLHDKQTYSVLKVLDEISKVNYGLEPKQEYRYAVSETADLNAPFEECKKFTPEDEHPYCFTGTGHNMFLFYEFSKNPAEDYLKECEKADEAHRGDCYDFFIYRLGINEAATKFLANDVEGGMELCNELPEAIHRPVARTHCYRGIGGGIGLYIDSEYAHQPITSGNLASMQKEVLNLINLCDTIDVSDDKLECYKGLLGTKVKKLYQDLNLNNLIIEKILPQITTDFEVVG